MSVLRKSARGKDCTLEFFPGQCASAETTVLAHVQMPGCGIMGGKVDDLSAVYACHSCHDILDRRDSRYREIGGQTRWQLIARALVRTHEIMIEEGTIERWRKKR